MSSEVKKSRRDFLRDSFVVAGAAGIGMTGGIGQAMAQAKPKSADADAGPPAERAGTVNIASNTLSEGPSRGAQDAARNWVSHSGSYGSDSMRKFIPELAKQLGVPADHIRVFPGSSPVLDLAVMTFVSPTRSLVTANPSYEQGWGAAPKMGAKVIKVLQRKDNSHDVQAMVAADKSPGVLYICNPNNPTGGITTRKDIEWTVANKPAGSILLVDEAYIHFSDNAVSAADLTVDHDVIVLRTFSKLYGMAGLRLGYAVAKPELLEKMGFWFRGDGNVASTTYEAGYASITDPDLVPSRRAYYGKQRGETIAWLEKQGFKCTKSESNCFMVDVKEDGKEFARKVATYGVNIGRTWPGFENMPRVSVGTETEMAKFRDAFAAVKAGKLGPYPMPAPRAPRVATLDGHRDAIGPEHGFEVG